MIRFRSRTLPLAAMLVASVPLVVLAAGPRPPLKPTTPGGVVTPESEAQHKTLTETERKKARFHLDFDKVDLAEVIKYIAQWTGKNFILADNLRGKITIIGPTDVNADEAYAAFLAALKTNNFQVTPTGKFWKVEPMKDTVRTPIPLCTEANCPDLPVTEQMVTRLFRMKYNDAEPMKNILQQFVSREGEIDPFPPDLLIVSDTGLNIRRIETLLKALDMPGSQDEINVVQLLHASAQEMSQTLLQIFQPQQGGAGGSKARPVMNIPKDPGAPAGPAGTKPAEAAGATQGDNGTVTVTKIIPEERSNKLIIIANPKAFLRVRELITRLDVATDTGQVHVYPLQNADAEEVAATLSSVASSSTSGRRGRTGGTPGSPTPAPSPAPSGAGASGSGALFTGEVKITADKSTNSLLIVASPSDYRNVLKVVAQLDIRRRQVFIEAVVMEVKLNDSNTLNVNLHTGYAVQNVNVAGNNGIAPVLIGSEESAAAASLSIASLASLTGFIAGIQGPPITVNGLNITLPSFGVMLNALQSNSDVNVISTPHLLTSDNEEAEIHIGQTVPFQSAVSTGSGLGGLASLAGLAGGTTSTATSSLGLSGLGGLLGGLTPIQRVPVELILKIKPHINDGDYVKLEIDEKVENIASVSQTLGPTTSNRSVKTTVFAKDQTSIVIGGLIQEQTTHSETRTPILGEIPVIGALFRADQITRDKTNLLLFLTPYIIRDQSDFRAIFERKLKERQEFVARYFGNEDQYQVKVDYDRKHGPMSILIRSVKEDFARAENGGPGAPDEKIFLSRPPDAAGTSPTVAPPATGTPPPPTEVVPPTDTTPPALQPGGDTPAADVPPPEGDAPPIKP